ncbi:hypothetical protein DPMN_005419 [Dreissena polymorpha]|uniref:Uncharacterized protein n=1 Tax=Dreissena polymorpha TaxID=45954 RepID=A0A9D4MQ81_DREPO|nr:hypothetical protein DPMN_005419 [Dreissena polymorpha]
MKHVKKTDLFFAAQDIIRTNVLTKFYEEVLTRIKSPPSGSHVLEQTGTISKLFQDIVKTNLLTKFHDDWSMNVTFRVLTSFYYSHIKKNAPPNMIGTNLLTKKNAPPPCHNVFQATGSNFLLVKNIIGKNLLTKFHDDPTINVASRVLLRKNSPPCGHVFQQIRTIFEVIQNIIGTNVHTKFHEDWTINITFRVLTSFNSSHIRKNAPPLAAMKNDPPTSGHVFQATETIFKQIKCPDPGGHVFQTTGTIFELVQDIIGTNLLSKFYENSDNMLTRQLLMPHNTRRITATAPPADDHVFQGS